MDFEQLKAVKKRFASEYGPKVEALGYYMGHGLSSTDVLRSRDASLPPGQPCISAHLQPMPGSPHPIDDGLLAKIRDTVLPKAYEGVPIYVEYIGRIWAQ